MFTVLMLFELIRNVQLYEILDESIYRRYIHTHTFINGPREMYGLK